MTKELISESWFNQLKDEFDKPYFVELKAKLRDAYRTVRVYPKPTEIFQAFKECSFENTRVVILAQDPYPFEDRDGIPHAHGIALSSLSKDTPASLRVIFKELDRDILKTNNYGEFKQALPTNNLTSWAKQGVLLLNTCLTVEAGHVGSHSEIGWQTFIQRVLIELFREKERLVCITLGKEAAQTVAVASIFTHETYPGRKPIFHLQTGHPASAIHGTDKFSGCNIFSKTNHYFWKNNLKEIEWKLNNSSHVN